jgi:hypothetical protein
MLPVFFGAFLLFVLIFARRPISSTAIFEMRPNMSVGSPQTSWMISSIGRAISSVMEVDEATSEANADMIWVLGMVG